jgi:PBP1b-binding outer membrane lipoprotein LpoB
MRYALPALAILALTACDRAPQEVRFADASITLPDDPLDLPALPGRDAVIENCTACHSPSTMLQQPQISREKWQATVSKMIEVYKAPVDEAAIPAIVDYMVAVQAQQVEGPPPPAMP